MIRNLSHSRARQISLPILMSAVLSICHVPTSLAQNVPPCSSDSAFSWLDFWVGDWDVYVDTVLAGENRIEKVLDDCAVMEHWTSADGGKGISLFYFLPVSRTWKQVWVTGHALARGGVKEKQLIERFDDGGVRFQGEIPLPNGGSYLDRTTLTPVSENEVRQLIEISIDDGANWRAVFDGRYVRKTP